MARRRKWKAATIRNLEGTLFIAPWLTGLFLFIAFPIGYSFYMSFHRVTILGTGIKYDPIGFSYYRDILFVDGGLLYNDLLPFLKQTVIMIPVILFFSLMVAILLNQKFLGRMLFRAIFFLPVIFSTGQVILEFITQGQGSLGFVEKYNIGEYVGDYLPNAWASPIITVLNSFVLILWSSGVQIIIFLAGRQTIGGSLYEAARIDGANPWETFWKITLPGMTPFILLNLIYTVVDLFTYPTNPIVSKVNTANYGQSSALAWIYFGIIFSFLAIVFAVFVRVTRQTAQSK